MNHNVQPINFTKEIFAMKYLCLTITNKTNLRLNSVLLFHLAYAREQNIKEIVRRTLFIACKTINEIRNKKSQKIKNPASQQKCMGI